MTASALYLPRVMAAFLFGKFPMTWSSPCMQDLPSKQLALEGTVEPVELISAH